MRRTHLRGREHILKRQLIHVGAFNLSLILRALFGSGKPREWKNQQGELLLRLFLSSCCCNAGMGRIARRNSHLRYSRCLLTQTTRSSGGARASEIQILAQRAVRAIWHRDVATTGAQRRSTASSHLPIMALKVVPSMQYGHRMTMGIGKCLGFGRLATLFRRQFDGVALVVHGVSLFINLAIFQVAGLATNPTLRS
jgi:hypothetical protein